MHCAGEHTGTWVEHHVYELVCSVQTSQMRMVSVLDYETFRQPQLLAESVGGRSAQDSTTDQTTSHASGALAQATAREKEQPT